MAKLCNQNGVGHINVLIVVDKFDYHGSYINGPTRYFSWLCKGIDKTKFNIFLYALRGTGKSDSIFRKEGLRVRYINAARYSPVIFLYLIKVIFRHRIHILHLTGYGSTTHGRIAALIARRPCIIHEHWVDQNINWIHEVMEKALSVLPCTAVACSDYARSYLNERKGLKYEQIRVIRNGVPVEQFSEISKSEGARMRKKWGLDEDKKIVGIVGMLHENKGHKYFIEAAYKVFQKRDTTFVIVGDGELRSQLQQQIDKLNCGSKIRLLGHQENMAAILQMLDIVVIASLSETAPLSLLEAMAAKRAIITTDCGGPAEVIKNNVTGLVVPPADSRAIADQIEYLLDNPDVAELLAGNAQAESENYHVSKSVRLMEKEYEDAVLRKH